MITLVTLGADFKVVSLKGTVLVRHGVQEQWKPVSAGDVLKPEDSIELNKKSSAIILVDGRKKITLPASVIIDLSDLRYLTQEELLLMLAMEQIRSVPAKDNRYDIEIPRTTTIHGSSKEESPALRPNDAETGLMQLNGTKVLFDHDFYATCVLKSKELFRLYPDLKNRTDERIMVAGALEKMNLNSEALSEYVGLTSGQLTVSERSIIEQKIKLLKKQNGK